MWLLIVDCDCGEVVAEAEGEIEGKESSNLEKRKEKRCLGSKLVLYDCCDSYKSFFFSSLSNFFYLFFCAFCLRPPRATKSLYEAVECVECRLILGRKSLSS